MRGGGLVKHSASYTMRDVARLASVSVTTVSSIVNGRAGVSPELTRRVEDAIATLDYHPNEVARGLKVKEKRSRSELPSPMYPTSSSTIYFAELNPRLAATVIR
jgi:DNA-binding LacI/PurR family transcriptional regulator